MRCARPQPCSPIPTCRCSPYKFSCKISCKITWRRVVAVDSPLAPANTPRFRLGLAKPNQEQIVLLITIALLIAFGLTLNGFATVNNLLNLLRSISILGILGLGMGLIVISRGIDLSEVAIMAGSWCVMLNAVQHGLPPLWAAAIALEIRIGTA